MNKLIYFLVFIALTSICKNLEAQELLLHLPMAGDATDISSYNNSGSISGGVTPTEDRFGKPCAALKFNGTNGYISIPHSSSLGNIKNEFSLSTWIKLDKANNDNNLRWLTLICKGELGKEETDMPQYRVQIFQGNTQSTVSINTEFTEKDLNFKNHDLEYDQWYNIILTYDKKNVNLYINAQFVWSFPYKEKLVKNSNNINIGRDIPGAIEYFRGSMSDLRLYDGPLKPNQILDIYQNSKSYAKNYTSVYACPADKVLPTDLSDCQTAAIVDFPTDISDCGESTVTQISGPKNGSKIGVGTEKVVFRITDNNGTSSNCTYNIQVVDKEAPIITPSNDVMIYIRSDQESIIYNYSIPKATDNCALKSMKLINGIKSNEPFPIGKNLLEFEAMDSSGNKTTSQFTVHVLQQKDESSTPNLDIQLLPAEPSFDEKLERIPREVGSKIEIEGLYFLADKAYINRNSIQQLDKVVKYLNKYPNISIEISGHTNGIPSEKYCDELSTARAKTCFEYLIDKGISKSRLKYIGYGKNQLKFPNDYKNPLNQRVEIKITDVK